MLRDPPEWVVTDGLLLGPAVTDESVRALSAGHGGRALTDTPSYARLRAFVRDEYAPAGGVGNLTILRRKPRN